MNDPTDSTDVSRNDDDVAVRLDQLWEGLLVGDTDVVAPGTSDTAKFSPLLKCLHAAREFLVVDSVIIGEDVASDAPDDDTTLPTELGNYELISELGRGGMGVVYKALQRPLGRTVAVKTIRNGIQSSAEAFARFRREAEAGSATKHPNIVAIHEWGDVGGEPFFSMDYVDGPSLAECFRGELLSLNQAIHALQTIASALQAAHDAGVLHRDLKPSNILLDQANQPFLTDFGLAKLLESDASGESTMAGTALGTPSYMSPEQAQGATDVVDHRSDIYSLGAILYEVLTGRPPFRGVSPIDTMRLVVSTPAVAPRMLNPDLPRDLETICLKALEKEPGRRYQRASEFGDELGRWLDGQPILARPISRPERVWRWSRRNPKMAVVSAGSVIGLTVAFALVTWQWRRAERFSEDALEKGRIARSAERAATKSADESRASLRKLLEGVQQLADLQFNMNSTAEARTARINELLAFFEEALADAPADPKLKSEFAGTWFRVAQIGVEHSRRGDLPLLKKSIAAFADLIDENPTNTQFRTSLGNAYMILGTNYSNKGQYDKAAPEFERARDTFAVVVTAMPDEVAPRRNMIAAAGNAAIMYRVLGNTDRARTTLDNVLTVLESILADEPDNTVIQLDLGKTYAHLASLHEPAERLEFLHKAQSIRQRLVDQNPDHFLYVFQLGSSYFELALTHRTLKQFDAAESHYRTALDHLERASDDSPAMSQWRMLLAETHTQLGTLLLDGADESGGYASLTRADSLYQEIRKASPELAKVDPAHITCLAALGQAQRRIGQTMASVETTRRRYALVGEDPMLLFDVARDLAECSAGLNEGNEKVRNEAIRILSEAVTHGFTDLDRLRSTPHFDPLRRHPDFESIVERLATNGE